MAHVSDLIATDIIQYLNRHERKSLLRFITCGSVDDGKSTLIGRLLFESKVLFEDQLAAVDVDSKKWGTQGGEIDFALLVDGLAAERGHVAKVENSKPHGDPHHLRIAVCAGKDAAALCARSIFAADALQRLQKAW